jgi:hypothetical protein
LEERDQAGQVVARYIAGNGRVDVIVILMEFHNQGAQAKGLTGTREFEELHEDAVERVSSCRIPPKCHGRLSSVNSLSSHIGI